MYLYVLDTVSNVILFHARFRTDTSFDLCSDGTRCRDRRAHTAAGHRCGEK